MTRPLLVVGNAVGVTTGEKNGERVLRAAAAVPGAAVVVLVEADDVSRLDGPVLDPRLWTVYHRGRDTEKDGTLLAFHRAYARALRPPTWKPLVPEWLPGQRRAPIETRWGLEVPLVLDEGARRERVLRIMGGHLAPPRSPDAYITHGTRQVRQYDPDLFAGDLNLQRRQAVRHFPRQDWQVRVPTGDVMGAVARRGVVVGRARRVRLEGSDHAGVALPI